MRKHAALLALLALVLMPFAVWASGVANNPGSQTSLTVQGTDPAGSSLGFPINVVNATGTSLDVNLTGDTFTPVGSPGDGLTNPANSVLVNNFPELWDGTFWQRMWNANAANASNGNGLLAAQVFGFDRSTGKYRRYDLNGSAANNALYVDGSQFTQPTQNQFQDAITVRTPTVFKTVTATAAGNTVAWTPAGGKKFRLMRYQIIVTDNATQAAPGTLTISLNDSGTALNQVHPVFVPAVGLLNSGSLYNSGWIDLGNGELSTAANNVLNINLSAALTAGQVQINECGTEE